MNNQLKEEITKLLDKIVVNNMESMDVITWGSPILSFGNPITSKFATVGLNPSNREFVDEVGEELIGDSRRFHTLRSLNLKSWTDIKERHLDLIEKTYSSYFNNNPYTSWFNSLDNIITSAGGTFYGPNPNACHLDLVPYATVVKWGELGKNKQTDLLKMSCYSLGVILKNTNIECIILNGMSVIRAFEYVSDVSFKKRAISSWSLQRSNGSAVRGYSFVGCFTRILSYELDRKVLVLGYNHNLQSSFGVTNDVKSSIKSWVGRQIRGGIK